MKGDVNTHLERLSSLLRVQHILHVVKDLMLALVKITAAIYKAIRPSQEKSVSGEIVLITGAGHGVGRALALQFADLGCTVICVDIDSESNEDTVNQIQTVPSEAPMSQKRTAFGYTCDVRDHQAVMRMARMVERELGRVDILISNTFTPVQPVANMIVAESVELININMITNFWAVMAFLPGMVDRKHGHIVAISSKTDVCISAENPPCSTAQFAVAGLMDSINKELCLEDNNIHITCVHPCVLCINPNMTDDFHLRILELAPEFAASEIIRGMRQNMTTLTIPRNLLFWINVFRSQSLIYGISDVDNLWQSGQQNMLDQHARAAP